MNRREGIASLPRKRQASEELREEPISPQAAPLGEILISRGLIGDRDLAQALQQQKDLGVKLGQALVGMGLVSELDVAEAIRSQGKIDAIHLTPKIVEPDTAQALGSDYSWNYKAVAVNRIAGITTVALEDPTDLDRVEAISRQVGTPVLPVYSGPETIQACLDHFFPKGFDAPSGLEQMVNEIEIDKIHAAVDDQLVERDDDNQDQPVIQFVLRVIEDALASRASDIHLEPRRDRFAIRFRIDGALLERMSLPKYWLRPTMTRLKVMAQLDIAQKRMPQDGRIQLTIQDKHVDLRMATAPTLEGEGAVIRILDGGRRVFTLDQLGMSIQQLNVLRRICSAKDGFVLTTGPTGAGKTTTLYSVLRQLNSVDRKIITLEDPVENEMEDAFQISANSKIGLDFASGLRAVLRLDPDVIMVGEIRDFETAKIAIQAALTGHLVLSTLSTVGTAETITRLLDIGIERYLLSDTIRGIVSQRLVKAICPHCRTKVNPPEQVLEAARLPADAGPFFEGKGCSQCLNTGYKGRIGLYEIMEMSPELYALVSRNTSAGDLHAAALTMGMIPLRADGLTKVYAGETTLDEVLSTTSRSQQS